MTFSGTKLNFICLVNSADLHTKGLALIFRIIECGHLQTISYLDTQILSLEGEMSVSIKGTLATIEP